MYNLKGGLCTKVRLRSVMISIGPELVYVRIRRYMLISVNSCIYMLVSVQRCIGICECLYIAV